MSLYGGIELPGHPDLENVRKLDLLPLPQIRRMMQVGVAVDKPWLQTLGEILECRKNTLREEITSYIPLGYLDAFVSQSGDEIGMNVDSAEQVGELLFKMLRVGQGEYLKMTPSGERVSTGKKQLEKLKASHPVIGKILEYREASKLKSTYADALPLLARQEEDSWVIHTQIMTTRTNTGRLASKVPNLQNIPIRSSLGAEVRKSFIPRPGKKLLSIDYSQIELRLLAHLSRDVRLLTAFLNNEDIHTRTAADSLNKKLEDVTPEERRAAKAINFGIVYGLTAVGLFDVMAIAYASVGLQLPSWVDVPWCQNFIDDYFKKYDMVRAYFQLQTWRATRYGMTWDTFGRFRLVPEVHSQLERVRAAGLRQAGNLPIQAAAAGVMKIGMARVERVLEQFRGHGVYAEALLPVHDELLIEADEEHAEEVREDCQWQMEQALVDEESRELRCRVPIKTEGVVMEDRWTKAA